MNNYLFIFLLFKNKIGKKISEINLKIKRRDITNKSEKI